MHFLVPSLAAMALILWATSALGGSVLHTVAEKRDSWSSLESRSKDQVDTEIAGPNSPPTVLPGPLVRITLANEGSTPLRGFSEWDVIFEVQKSPGLSITSLTYTAQCPSTNQWTIRGIYSDAASTTPEADEPGTFNTGEEVIVLAKLSPETVLNTYDRATFATSNGVTAKVLFKVATVTPTLHVVDDTDRLVYRYLDGGTLLATSTLEALNDGGRGITTDLANFWTADDSDDAV